MAGIVIVAVFGPVMVSMPPDAIGTVTPLKVAPVIIDVGEPTSTHAAEVLHALPARQ
jgi:hypothetical protein